MNADRGALRHSRRDFVAVVTAGALGAALAPRLPAAAAPAVAPGRALLEPLLHDWCAALLALQIRDPGDPGRHGALRCPSCAFLHGRCMDALYPFLHVARATGDRRYVTAARDVFDWAERNVSRPDGSWTVIPDPDSWTGITVFGAIALAEALKLHGDLLPAEVRVRWTGRLRRAAAFVHETFTLDFTNINYGGTALHALHLFGDVLGEPAHVRRSHELARGMKAWFTEPNALLFGEGKPAGVRSPRGLPAVDLGYNVEETLNGIALYALAAGDRELTALIERSMAAHLEFMLPDGAWDNSWGTRQAKWSYWGSRTTDGCQPGFAAMAHRVPAFGAAAWWSTHLLARCTHEGLLHGGPHYVTHGVKPCVHHTFTHAKALAHVLDHPGLLARVTPDAPLPRAVADGVREFPEIAVRLAARGAWRATVSAYDNLYRKDTYQVTGGALGIVHHALAGPLFAGSMARYVMVERNNMQPHPAAGDDPLTPRLELVEDGVRYSQLFDLRAEVAATDRDGVIVFRVGARLVDENGADPPSGPAPCALEYRFSRETLVIRVEVRRAGAVFVAPLVSSTGEPVRWTGEHEVEVRKPGCVVTLAANAPLRLQPRARTRVFNHVPGLEAIPLEVAFAPDRAGPLELVLQVRETA